MIDAESIFCQNANPHGPHQEMRNVYDEAGRFQYEDFFVCPGFDPQAEEKLKEIADLVKSYSEEALDEKLSEAQERERIKQEIFEYDEKPPVDPFEGISAKDPELQAKMNAYSAQAERLQHQEYLKRLREAAENGEIKEYPNRAQRRANAKANRKAK